MLQEFKEQCKKLDINISKTYHEKTEDCDVIIMGLNAPLDNNEVYETAVVFYNEEGTADVYIRKRIDMEDNEDIYKHINFLNETNRWVSFYCTDNALILKSSLYVDKTNTIFSVINRNMMIAQDNFVNYNPAMMSRGRKEHRQKKWIN